MYYNDLNRQQEENEDDDLKFIPLNIKEPFSEKDSSWFPIVNMNSPNISHMTNNFILGFSNPSDGEILDENFLKTIDYVPNVKYGYADENYFNTYDEGNLPSNMSGSMQGNMQGGMLGSMTGNMQGTMAGNMSGNNYNQGFSQESGYLSSNMLTNTNTSGMNNQSGTSFSNNFNLEYPSETQSEALYSYNKEKNCNGATLGYGNTSNINAGNMGMSDGTGNMNTGAAGINNNMGNMNTGTAGMNSGMGNMNTGTAGMNSGMGNMNTGTAGMNSGMGNMNTGTAGMNSGMGNMNTGAAGMNSGMGNMNTGAAGMNSGMGNMNTGTAGMNSGMGNMNTGTAGMNSNMGNMNTGFTGMNSGIGNMSTGAAGMNNNMWNMNAGFTGINSGMGNMNAGFTGMNNNMWNMNNGVSGVNDNINNIWDDDYQGSMDEEYVPFTNYNNLKLTPNIQSMEENNENISMGENANNLYTGSVTGVATNTLPNSMDINYNDSEPNYTLTNIPNMNPLNMGPSYTVPEGFDINDTSNQIETLTATNPKIDNSYNSFEKLNDYMKNYEKSGVIREDKEIEEPPHMRILRDLDLGSEYESIYRDDKSKEIDSIFKKIEENHGAIISTLKAYRVPHPIISLLVKKIIKITLEHSNKE
ncbi:hypothetical protein [Clostridium sp. D46t1_190503_E9]|uniref:hypothetical protein n=1 Tax=Clostridium sp. D46t1_190503_E9 TaxID=2787137 RepID=UPI0018990559|nr:hypothetical protein [Clostridium sp. D46t1_190503_E9]